MDDGTLDLVIPARGHWSGRVPRGARLRIVDLEGCQAVDFLCYNAADPTDRYCAADTMKIAGSIYIGRGSRLYSDMGNLLFTVVDDTCGRHDTIGGCCSRESNRLREADRRQLRQVELRPAGLRPLDQERLLRRRRLRQGRSSA